MSQKWRQRKCSPPPCQTLCPMPFLSHSPSNSHASFNTHLQAPNPCTSLSPSPDHSGWQLTVLPSLPTGSPLRPGPRSDCLEHGARFQGRRRRAVETRVQKPLMICPGNPGVPLRPALQDGRQGCMPSQDHSAST